MNPEYSPLKTSKKALVAGVFTAIASEVAIAMTTEVSLDGEQRWSIIVLAFLVAIGRGFLNAFKHSPLPPSDTRGAISTPALAALLLLTSSLLLSAGCATSVTTRFSETLYDEAGKPSETVYEVKSKGDVDQTVHEFAYRYGGEENVIAVGQSASGVTSPAQTEAINALLALPPEVLQTLTTAIKATP